MKRIIIALLYLGVFNPVCFSQTLYGTSNYVEYQIGNLPIIISVPHGGDLTPSSIPTRTCNNPETVTDAFTIETAEKIKAALFLATGCYEEHDGGITRFGRQVIKEMNRVGMVIDMSHSAEKSTLEAIDKYFMKAEDAFAKIQNNTVQSSPHFLYAQSKEILQSLEPKKVIELPKVEEVNSILQALGNMPYAQVVALVENIKNQAIPQVPAPETAPAPDAEAAPLQ